MSGKSNKVPSKGDKSKLVVIHNLAGSEEMTEKENKGIAQGERSTGQKVAKGIAIALIVIAAFWGLFAAPVVAISGGASEAVIGLLILALVFFLVSLPFFYLGRKRKEKIITATTAEKEEDEEGGEEENNDDSTNAYDQLAAQLLAAKLNIENGVPTCESIQTTTIQYADTILRDAHYVGPGSTENPTGENRDYAFELIEILDRYNNSNNNNDCL